MSWLKKAKEGLKAQQRRRELPDGLWTKCEDCGEILYHKELERLLWTCSKCSYHFRISAKNYIRILLDEGSFVEHFTEVVSTDPLRFRDSRRYSDRLKKAREETGLTEAIMVGEARIDGRPLVIGLMDFSFLGGSLASAAAERIARGILLALDRRWPFAITSSSGGARMFEGILSLMQMAKTNALLARFSDAGLPYISILTHPTTGGVTASYASVGDVIIAEPKALIGFAGPRVIKQTINQELPEGFQRSEFLLSHGMVDMIVHRTQLRQTLSWLLQFFEACGGLPQKPRRRAGETFSPFLMERIGAGTAGPPAATTAPPAPVVPAGPPPDHAGAEGGAPPPEAGQAPVVPAEREVPTRE